MTDPCLHVSLVPHVAPPERLGRNRLPKRRRPPAAPPVLPPPEVRAAARKAAAGLQLASLSLALSWWLLCRWWRRQPFLAFPGRIRLRNGQIQERPDPCPRSPDLLVLVLGVAGRAMARRRRRSWPVRGGACCWCCQGRIHVEWCGCGRTQTKNKIQL